MRCVDFKKTKFRGYCICQRDGSVRKVNRFGYCSCIHHRPTLWSRFIRWVYSED